MRMVSRHGGHDVGSCLEMGSGLQAISALGSAPTNPRNHLGRSCNSPQDKHWREGLGFLGDANLRGVIQWKRSSASGRDPGQDERESRLWEAEPSPSAVP